MQMVLSLPHVEPLGLLSSCSHLVDPVVLVPVQPHNLRGWSREPIVQRTGIRL